MGGISGVSHGGSIIDERADTVNAAGGVFPGNFNAQPIGSGFQDPVAVANRAEAKWTRDDCVREAAIVATRVPLVVRENRELGRHLVYLPASTQIEQGSGGSSSAGDVDGDVDVVIRPGEAAMILPPNVLKRDCQMRKMSPLSDQVATHADDVARYNSALQVRPKGQRPGALYSLSESPQDLDNFIAHSCDPNCDVMVFPTNYAIQVRRHIRDSFVRIFLRRFCLSVFSYYSPRGG